MDVRVTRERGRRVCVLTLDKRDIGSLSTFDGIGTLAYMPNDSAYFQLLPRPCGTDDAFRYSDGGYNAYVGLMDIRDEGQLEKALHGLELPMLSPGGIGGSSLNVGTARLQVRR